MAKKKIRRQVDEGWGEHYLIPSLIILAVNLD